MADDVDKKTMTQTASEASPAPSWYVRAGKDGELVLRGSADPKCGSVSLLYGDRVCGHSRVSGGQFRFIIQRAVGRLPKDAQLRVMAGQAPVPHESGAASWQIEAPFAADSGSENRNLLDIDAELDLGKRLTKKGLFAADSLPEAIKDRYRRLYRSLDSWFEARLSYPVLLTHGTLLGIYRDGDLIPHDDDFDCAYISAAKDAKGAADERLEIMRALKADGFNLFVGATGHLKVQIHRTKVDLMPGWIEDGVLNISSYTVIPGADHFVMPPSTLDWQGTSVRTFHDPEVFLRAQYGPGWKTPDPGYRPALSSKGQKNRKLLLPREAEVEEFGSKALKAKNA